MQNHFDFIDDYITRSLSLEDNIAFEKNIHSNPALMSAVENQKQLLANLKRVRMKQLISEATANMPAPTKPSYRWLVIGTAITVFSVAMGYFIWRNDDIPMSQPAPIENKTIKPIVPQATEEPRADAKQKPTPTENKVVPVLEEKSKIAETVPEKQVKALDSVQYAIADAPIGFDNWDEKSTIVRGESDEQTYFEAYKNLKNKNFSKAIEIFKALSQNKQFRNYRRAEWYLALGQLAQNPSSKNEILNVIANTEGHYFQQKAKSIKRYLQHNNR